MVCFITAVREHHKMPAAASIASPFYPSARACVGRGSCCSLVTELLPMQGRSTRGGRSGFGRCTFPNAAFFHRAALTRQQMAGESGVGQPRGEAVAD